MKLAQKIILQYPLEQFFSCKVCSVHSYTVNTAHPLSRHDLPVIISVRYTFNLECNHLIHR